MGLTHNFHLTRHDARNESCSYSNMVSRGQPKVKKVWLFHHIMVAKSEQIGCNILRGVEFDRCEASVRGVQ